MNKTFKVLNFKLKKQQLGADIFGAYKSAFHGTGMEFAEHREYIPGDEIKHIDWKVSARTNKLYVKKYDEERNLNVLFLIDLNPSFYQFPKKLEILKETFFILALSANQANDNIACLIQNKFFQPSKSIHVLPNIISEIDKTKHFTKNLKYSIEKIKNIKNHLIFILTDETNTDIKNLRKIEANNNEIVYINIFDYFENNLEYIPGFIDFRDAQYLVSIDLENPQKIEKYRTLRQGKINYLKNELEKSQIGYVYIDTTLSPFKQLYKFFLHRNFK